MTKDKARYLQGGTLIDGNGGKPVKDPVIVLDGKRIREVGTKATVRIPRDAEVIDCARYTIMPGFVDAHLHTAMFNCLTFHNYRVAQWEITPELQQMYSLFHAQLCFDMGFTTLRDLGMNSSRGQMTAHLCGVRDSIDMGIFPGPRMLVAGWASITGSHLDLIQPRAMQRLGFQTADGPWELRKLARENLRIGCDIVKTCVSGGGGTDKEEPDIRNMTQEELNAIVDEAHAFHKIAAAHCFTPQAQRMAIEAGADTLEHMVFHDEDSVERIVESGVWVTPTLLHRTDHAIQCRREQGTAEFVLSKMKKIQSSCWETFQKMYRSGVNIAFGTDMGYDPEMGTNARELELYVDLGMKPMDALQVLTKNAARAIKMDKEIGTIEAGKLADIVAINGDPLRNIRVLQEKKNICMVMKDGRIDVDRRPGRNRSCVMVAPGDWKLIDYQ
jgi:imidazolonepropionase-like amidohydrolase